MNLKCIFFFDGILLNSINIVRDVNHLSFATPCDFNRIEVQNMSQHYPPLKYNIIINKNSYPLNFILQKETVLDVSGMKHDVIQINHIGDIETYKMRGASIEYYNNTLSTNVITNSAQVGNLPDLQSIASDKYVDYHKSSIALINALKKKQDTIPIPIPISIHNTLVNYFNTRIDNLNNKLVEINKCRNDKASAQAQYEVKVQAKAKAKAEGEARAASPKVTIHDKINGNGRGIHYLPGRYEGFTGIGKDLNFAARSITVPNNMYIYIYEHENFIGPTIKLIDTVANLSAIPKSQGYYNDENKKLTWYGTVKSFIVGSNNMEVYYPDLIYFTRNQYDDQYVHVAGNKHNLSNRFHKYGTGLWTITNDIIPEYIKIPKDFIVVLYLKNGTTIYINGADEDKGRNIADKDVHKMLVKKRIT